MIEQLRKYSIPSDMDAKLTKTRSLKQDMMLGLPNGKVRLI